MARRRPGPAASIRSVLVVRADSRALRLAARAALPPLDTTATTSKATDPRAPGGKWSRPPQLPSTPPSPTWNDARTPAPATTDDRRPRSSVAPFGVSPNRPTRSSGNLWIAGIDIRITSKFITGYSVRTANISARQAGHGAQSLSPIGRCLVPRMVPRRRRADHRSSTGQ